MNTTQFLFLENGQAASKLKNSAKTQLKSLKKEGKKLQLSEILDSLAKEITGKSYKSSIKDAKINSPYLNENDVFCIPFYDGDEKHIVELNTLQNDDDSAAFKKTNISVIGSDFSLNLYDILFFPKLINIEKIKNGWRLHLYLTEQAKCLNGFNGDEDFWFDIVKYDDGIEIGYYQTEYSPTLEGYNVNLIESEFISFENIDKTKCKSCLNIFNS